MISVITVEPQRVLAIQPTLTDLVAELRSAAPDRRVIIGISGVPGSGKSTLAEALVAALGDLAVWVPMDGYHLGDVELLRQGILDRKGAPETFDARGYARLLSTLATELDHTVYAPNFDRGLEQPVAGAIPVFPHHRIVVTEGNYLLLGEDGWSAVAGSMDTIWHVESDPTVRRDRLIARHERFGKDSVAAAAWVDEVDEVNARLIDTVKHRADVILDLSGWTP